MELGAWLLASQMVLHFTSMTYASMGKPDLNPYLVMELTVWLSTIMDLLPNLFYFVAGSLKCCMEPFGRECSIQISPLAEFGC